MCNGICLLIYTLHHCTLVFQTSSELEHIFLENILQKLFFFEPTDIAVPLEMSGNQFPNSVTWHVITYSFLFTLGLLSKFHGLHLFFAFRELKKNKDISCLHHSLKSFMISQTSTLTPPSPLFQTEDFSSICPPRTEANSALSPFSAPWLIAPSLRGNDESCTWYSPCGEIVDFRS